MTADDPVNEEENYNENAEINPITKEGSEREERKNSVQKEIRNTENIPLISKEEEVMLTKEMEEAIIGPESFTWCGLGPLTSQWLQTLARPEAYLAIFSLSAFAQGIFFSYTTGTLSTVERRFKLPSAASGFISTGNDVLQLFLSLPLAYAAGNGHRPRWLGWGLLLAAGGCLLIITPHFIFGAGDCSDLRGNHDQTDVANQSIQNNVGWDSCTQRREDVKASCSEKSAAVGTEQYTVAILMFFGQVLSGLANVCFYVVGYSYMDEAVSKAKAPLYFAISGCLRIFGPVTGMALSGYAVGKWVDLGVEPTISPSHPRWVGAWWLGYPFIMMLLLLACVPMMMMPRMLPGMRKRLVDKLRAAAKQGAETLANYKNTIRPIDKTRFREMIPAIRRVSRKKIFVTLVVNQTLFWVFLIGYWMFQLKYMEHNFKIPAAEANKSMALAGMLASLIGWLGTGSILTYFKPSSKIIMYITMGISLLCMSTFIVQLSITCEKDHIIGLDNVLSKDEPTELKFHKLKSIDNAAVSSCMTNCSCEAKYSPVCVNNKYLFFSACHAGCTKQVNVNGTLRYSNCKCGDIQISIEDEAVEQDSPAEVRSGLCRTGCDKFWTYVTFSVIAQMFVAANRAIANILVFRSVDERDKDIALGILNIILSLAFVVQPIIVGGLVDLCCQLWQTTCGRRGHCYLYDLNMYKWVLHGMPAMGMFLSFVTEAIIFRWHKEIDFFGDKEMENLQLKNMLRRKYNNKKEGDTQGLEELKENNLQ